MVASQAPVINRKKKALPFQNATRMWFYCIYCLVQYQEFTIFTTLSKNSWNPESDVCPYLSDGSSSSEGPVQNEGLFVLHPDSH